MPDDFPLKCSEVERRICKARVARVRGNRRPWWHEIDFVRTALEDIEAAGFKVVPAEKAEVAGNV